MKEWLLDAVSTPPITRSDSMIPRKGRFKAPNPTKIYRPKRSKLSIAAYAAACRANRLANPTLAEQKMEELLKSLNIRYERERIVFYGDRFLLMDFWLPGPYVGGICLEVDGVYHKKQARYDAGRDAYLKNIGVTTYRFTNTEVLKTQAKSFERLKKILNQRQGT